MTSRYPQPVSPWLNLVKLLTPTSWAWTLASLATVALCFNVASLVVRRWMGMRLKNIEIDLWPLRVNFPNTTRLIFKEGGKARVPERTSLHSFNLLWLMWAVCGGFFITNFILSVWLTFLMKPVFETPLDNAHVI